MGKLARESILVTIFIAVGIVIGSVTNIFFFPYIASKNELGEFKLFLYWSSIFSLFATLGTQGYFVRSYHSYKQAEKLGELNFLILFVPLLGLMLIALLIWPFYGTFMSGMSREGFTISNAQTLLILCLFTLFQTYVRAYSSAVISLKKNPWLFFNTDIISRITLVIAFSLFAVFKLNLYQLLLLVALSFLVQVVFVIYLGRSIVFKHGLKVPPPATIVQNFKVGLYLMLDSAATLLVNRLDVIMIGYLAINSNSNTQEFDIASNLSLFVFMPWRTLTNTSISFIAEAFKDNDIPRIEMIYKKTSLHLFLMGSIIFTFIFSNIDNIIKMIPDDYTTIKYTVFFLGIAKIVDMVFSVNNNILVLSPYYRYNLVFSIILIGITIMLNFVFIPPFGITGTAISTLIVIVVFNLLKFNMIKRKYKIHPFHGNTVNVLLFMAIIFCISLLIPNVSASAFINITFRGSITALMFYAYLVFIKPSEDIEKIRLNVLKRLRLLK
jgi:O-antigen/teichoic acid export membrane protein